MEATILNFKVLEVTGETKKEAWANAPFEVIGDATQAFKNWKAKQNGEITKAMLNDFYLNYLQNKVKCAAGVGFAITKVSAVSDSRERPYQITNVKGEGKRKMKRTYSIIEKATGKILAAVQTTQADAKKKMQDLYKDGTLKGDAYCKISQEVVEGEPIAFTAKYTPSKSSHKGEYIVFGVEA